LSWSLTKTPVTAILVIMLLNAFLVSQRSSLSWIVPVSVSGRSALKLMGYRADGS
jgi:hypothetical protein